MKVIYSNLKEIKKPEKVEVKKEKKHFDCVYVINLDHRTDRLKSIDEQFKKIGLAYERYPAIKEANGTNGCRLSHLAVLQNAKARGFKKILICEDDLVLRRKFIEDIEGILRDAMEFDLLFFHHPQPSDIKPNGKLVCAHRAPWCAHLYAVGNIDIVLGVVLNNDVDNKQIDSIFVNNKVNSKMTIDEYAFQLPNHSDINNGFEHRFKHMFGYEDFLLDFPIPVVNKGLIKSATYGSAYKFVDALELIANLSGKVIITNDLVGMELHAYNRKLLTIHLNTGDTVVINEWCPVIFSST